jgi:hypothetical protein
VEIDNLFDAYGGGFPAKYMDTHLWIRLGKDGKPQLIRVEPMVTDEGQLIPQNVVLFIDEAPPQIVDRDAAEQMLSTPNCEPLEHMLQWKHKIRH